MRDARLHEVLPVTNTREETRAAYDRMARFYDLAEGYWERKARRAGIQALGLRPGERVVEIGFGTGEAIVTFARLVGASGRVEGVDLSPKMVAAARKRVSANALEDVVSLRQGDAVGLPYADGQFDAAFMSFTLELFGNDDMRAVLVEMLRVVRPGGRLCVVALSRAGEDTLMRCLYEWGHTHFPHVLDCRPIYVAESIEDAGFGNVESVRSTLWRLPIELAVGVRPTSIRPPGNASQRDTR